MGLSFQRNPVEWVAFGMIPACLGGLAVTWLLILLAFWYGPIVVWIFLGICNPLTGGLLIMFGEWSERRRRGRCLARQTNGTIG